MTFLALTGLLNFFSSAGLGILVYRKCPDRSLAVTYGLVNFAIAVFSLFYFLWQMSASTSAAYFNMEGLTVAAMWINQAFLAFIITYVGMTPFRRAVLWIAGILNIAFSICNYTGVLYSSVEPRFGLGYWPNVHPFFIVYLLFWHVELLYTFGAMVRRFRTAVGPVRNQMKYMLMAFAVGYIGGISNWPMWFKIYFPPYYTLSISVYCALMAYAMVKHHLMDINVIVRRTLLYSVISAGLASIYTGAVTLLARLLESHAVLPALYPVGLLEWIGNNLQVSFAYSCVATSFFSVGLGLFVWIKGRQKPINQMWALTCLSIAAWSLGKGMMARAGTFSEAYAWQEWCTYLGATTIPVLFLHFVFLVLNKRPSWSLKLGYIAAILLFILNVTGQLVSIKARPPFHFYTLPLRPFGFYLAYFFGLVIYAHALLVRGLFNENERLKNQIKFILLGTSIGFLGGSTSFFLTLNIPIFPYGIYAVPLYIVTVSYSIFKHQLMDISFVIRKTLLYSLVSAALAAIYVGTITLLAHFLEGQRGSMSAYTSALAAVFITLLFNPIRTRLQVFIDRKFTRERADLEQKMAEFSAAVVNEHHGAKVTHALFRVLEKGFHPKAIALYERIGNGKGFGKSDSLSLPWPELEDGDAAIQKLVFGVSPEYPLVLSPEDLQGFSPLWQAGVRVVIPLQSRGEWTGALLLGEKKSEETYSNEDLVLLRIIANQAAVAYERPKLVREVSGGFVHEVKMPLSKISLPAELTYLEIGRALEEGGEPDEFLERIQRRMQFIMDQAKLAAQRVDALRELGSSRENQREPEPLADVIAKSLISVEDLLAQEHVAVKVEIPTGFPTLRAESEQLEILFANLFKNAAESMATLPSEKDRQIHICAGVTEGHVLVEVKDNGPGIPAEARDLIFQPHYTTKGVNGTGMGLFLCRQIVQAHGGTISVKSEEARGTTFLVRFPRSR